MFEVRARTIRRRGTRHNIMLPHVPRKLHFPFDELSSCRFLMPNLHMASWELNRMPCVITTVKLYWYSHRIVFRW